MLMLTYTLVTKCEISHRHPFVNVIAIMRCKRNNSNHTFVNSCLFHVSGAGHQQASPLPSGLTVNPSNSCDKSNVSKAPTLYVFV
jgi:hypothetical protein